MPTPWPIKAMFAFAVLLYLAGVLFGSTPSAEVLFMFEAEAARAKAEAAKFATDPNAGWQWDAARREWFRWVTPQARAAPGRATPGAYHPLQAAPARFFSAPFAPARQVAGRGSGGGC